MNEDIVRLVPIHGSPYKVQVQKNWLDKGAVFCMNPPDEFVVTKVYPENWWKRLRRWLGFNVVDFVAKPYNNGRN